jgi:hypothetical protein
MLVKQNERLVVTMILHFCWKAGTLSLAKATALNREIELNRSISL